VINWKNGAGKLYYPESASNTRVVGAMTAQLMEHLMKEGGTEWSKLWCIGHSLGSHVCGHAGHKAVGKVGRITGMCKCFIYYCKTKI
jgi:hypothetical protein